METPDQAATPRGRGGDRPGARMLVAPAREPVQPIVPAAMVGLAVVSFGVLAAMGADGVIVAAAALVPLAAAAGLSLLSWLAVRRHERRLIAVAEAVGDERLDERRRLERHARRLEDALSHERVLLQRLRASWQAEREWSRELRRQLQDLHARVSGGGAGRSDLLKLVLEAAIQLVNAEKGLLLTREDDDGDGDLDLVVASGFAHDPEHSATVQRFARQVLARDEIVREDDPPPPAGGTAAVDEEIDALVAVPLYLRDRFHGVIVCANRPGGFADLDDDVLLALGNQAGAALQQGRLSRDVRDAQRAAVRVLAEAVSARDPVVHRESASLSVLASGLARDLGLGDHDRDVLVVATLLRAVGYLPLSDRLLLQPGPLGPDERALISLHPRLGFEILRQAPTLREPALTLLYHHERYDGQGYPAGLRGQDIPLTARALSVLEAFGAMTHDRPYRAARDPDKACEELIEHAGTQFDPEIVPLLVERVRQAEAQPSDEVVEVLLESLPLEERPGGSDGSLQVLEASAVDGLTLLGDHRALQRALADAATDAAPGRCFAVVLVELQDLRPVNEELGYTAGDRLIQVAARRAAIAATRLGATAYRASGRRLALQVPLREGDDLGDLLADIRTEFMAGPSVEVVASAWKPGDRGQDVLARARRALRRPPA